MKPSRDALARRVASPGIAVIDRTAHPALATRSSSVHSSTPKWRCSSQSLRSATSHVARQRRRCPSGFARGSHHRRDYVWQRRESRPALVTRWCRSDEHRRASGDSAGMTGRRRSMHAPRFRPGAQRSAGSSSMPSTNPFAPARAAAADIAGELGLTIDLIEDLLERVAALRARRRRLQHELRRALRPLRGPQLPRP